LEKRDNEREERGGGRGERAPRERKNAVNIMVGPRIFANFGDISALVWPTNARILV